MNTANAFAVLYENARLAVERFVAKYLARTSLLDAERWARRQGDNQLRSLGFVRAQLARDATSLSSAIEDGVCREAAKQFEDGNLPTDPKQLAGRLRAIARREMTRKANKHAAEIFRRPPKEEAATAPSAEDIVIARDRVSKAITAFERLTPTDRRVMKYLVEQTAYGVDLTGEDIADALEMTPAGVRQALSRGREQLRKLVDGTNGAGAVKRGSNEPRRGSSGRA